MKGSTWCLKWEEWNPTGHFLEYAGQMRGLHNTRRLSGPEVSAKRPKVERV